MTMVERIARAICQDEYETGYASGAEIEACIDDDMSKPVSRARLLRVARAAIRAMRPWLKIEGLPPD
jgi:hypothetical protein